jgi:signal transduction histidine kinase/DNA-binding response OmpR family regulator
MEAPMNLDYDELQQGISGMVFATKQPVLSPHANDGIEPETTRARRIAGGVGALIVVPFVTKGRVIGTITAANRINQRVFTPHDVELLMALTTQAATVIENVRLYEETRQAKEEAEQARARAEVANHAKSDFLSRMSHELRTPLNGILGYAQILKNDADLSRRQADGLSVIQQSGEHLLTLITDILDLAKIEAGRFELLPTPIQLDIFMQNTLAIIQMRAEKKRLELNYQPLSMIPDAVAVDEKRLRQILLNLLNNAIKFTETGQVTLQLELIDQPDVNQVRLRFAVVDTGVGMTPEQLQQIFNPFEQVGDMKKRAEGTGLGLAISNQLVEAMGGQLQVASELGHGSTFWFELPLPLANLTLTQTPLSHERIVGYEGEPRKILVVDDKINNRMVFLNILEPLGFEICMAEDGQEAIEQAENWQPDLILMDMIMPNVTGFEATQMIRSNPTLKTIAIIGTSASAFEKEAERVKLAGCDAFISKPVHVEELVILIGELLHLQWRYQETVAATVSPTESRQAEMVRPPLELIQRWQTLARQGDLLTIEDEADALLKDNPRYAPFVEKIQDYVISMDISELTRFLAEQS